MDPGSEDALESHGESSKLLWLRDAVAMATLRARQKLFQGAIMLCALFLLLWMAAFLYGSFYYSYMPNAMYTTPVHFYYRTECDYAASDLCSFPVANISLLRNGKNQVMIFGQPYRISLQLDMPDSPANRELGMFIVRMTCYSKERRDTVVSSRSTMLRYRSGLLRNLGTLLFLPVFLTGVFEQKQQVEVELFSDYTDSPYVPSVGAIVEILSNRVQIYSAQLFVHAHFSGIRYFLMNFPLMSALVGVGSNFVFLSMLLLFSYVRLLLGPEGSLQRSGGRPSRDRGQQQFNEDDTAESSSLADTQALWDPLRIHLETADANQEAEPVSPEGSQGGEEEQPSCSQSE